MTNTPAFQQRIDQIASDLDAYTYYSLLNITPAANLSEIRRAFHAMARSLHPDRFHASRDSDLKDKAARIYKRIAEAYRILRHQKSRADYDAALAKGERRLLSTERPNMPDARPEMTIQNIQARKFFLLARGAEARQDKKSARLNYQFALNLEGEHPLIQERLDGLAQS